MTVVVAHARRFERQRRILSGLTAVLVFAGALCGTAQAKDTYVFSGNLGATPGGGVAVDDANGDVLVAANPFAHEVQVWGPGGPGVSAQVTSFNAGLTAPYDVAVNQSTGAAYVIDQGGNEIQALSVAGADSGTYTVTFSGQTTAPIAFDADAATLQARLIALSNVAPGDVTVDGSSAGAGINFAGAYTHVNVPQITINGAGLHDDPVSGPAVTDTSTTLPGGAEKLSRFVPDNHNAPTSYTLDGTFTSPAKGTGAGQIGSFASAIAVDPATGNLLVADNANKRVKRFNATGGLVSSYDGSSSSGGAFENLFDIAVGAGVTYVVDATGPFDAGSGQLTGTSRVVRFDAAGASLGALPNTDDGMNHAKEVAYGAGTGGVFVAEQGTPGVNRLHVFRNNVQYQVLDLGNAAPLSGLAVDDSMSTSPGRVYVADTAASPSVVDLQRLPDVTLDAPSAIDKRSAHLTGTVDPNAGTSTSHFEYSADRGATWTPLTTTGDTSTAPTIAHPEADVAGLDPSSSYQVRLVAETDQRPGDPVISGVQTFLTLGDLPTVANPTVTDRTTSSATVRGQITPFGQPTTFHVEYGLTSAYGVRAPATGERSAGSTQTFRGVAQVLQGLLPGTTYHARLVAHNATGDTVGGDVTFTTLTTAQASSRGYELVSPAAKGDNNVVQNLAFQASEDGDAISYISTAPLLPDPESAPLYPRYVAQRSANGWSNQATDPAQAGTSGLGQVKVTFGVSDDGTKAVVMSLRALAPGATPGSPNVYFRDVTTGAMTWIATSPDVSWFVTEAYTLSQLYVQGTPNFDHLLLRAEGTSFLPGVPSGAMYEWTGGRLRVVSTDPGGAPISADNLPTSTHGKNFISRDGARVTYESAGGVYLRSGGVSRQLAVSHRSSDPGTAQAATGLGGDQDLKYVFFFSQDLTDDSDPGLTYLYRYDTAADQLVALTKADDAAHGNSLAVIQVSADGSAVYFATRAPLTTGADDAGENLYAWRGGVLKRIAQLDITIDQGGTRRVPYWWVSTNGRYFAYASGTPNIVSGLNTQNVSDCSDSGRGEYGYCQMIFRYDQETDHTICVSCTPDGSTPRASAVISSGYADVGTHAFPRSVNDRGQVFFASKEALVERDINATWDVYEWDGDQVDLISSGRGTSAKIADISADGNNVFFTTNNQLDPRDTDDSTDVYDARVGGGFPFTPPVQSTCIAEDCRGAGGSTTPVVPAPSENVNGVSDKPTSPAKAKISKLTAGFKGTVLNLTVTVSGAGTIQVSGPKINAVKRRVNQAGSYKLKIKLTSKQAKLRRQGKKVTSAMTVSFTPVFGKAAKTKITRTAAR